MIIDEMPDGRIFQKFYDSDKNHIAGRTLDGRIFPSEEFKNADLSFLGQLETLADEPGISFTEVDRALEDFSKKLGIDKKDIFTISETELDQTISEKSSKNSDGMQISLDDKDKNDDITTTQNEAVLDGISAKQETDLDKKIDDRHTLAEVLGVPAGSKLIAVYSDSIKGNSNTTMFSFIIKAADGTLSPADMLNQTGGKSSDKNIYKVNHDGSTVEKQSVQSSYAIDSPIIENGILSARIGSMGNIELRLWTS